MSTENKGLKFNPTLSFDGVAIVIGVIMLSAWLAKMEQRVTAVEQTQAQDDARVLRTEQNLERLDVLSGQLAVLINGKRPILPSSMSSPKASDGP